MKKPFHALIKQLLRDLPLKLSLCATLAITACASVDNRPPEEQIRQRVAERWQAMAARDFDRAYTYTTPGFRALVSQDSYRSRFGIAGAWVGGQAVAVNCAEATKCVARVRVEVKPLLVRGIEDTIVTHIDETWLFDGGQWWLYQPISEK